MRRFTVFAAFFLTCAACAFDARPLFVGSWIHVELKTLEKSSSADAAMRAAALRRLTEWTNGAHRAYAMALLWTEVAKKHETDPALSKLLEPLLATTFPYAVPASLQDVYRAAWDERYAKELAAKPGSCVALTVQVAKDLREFLKEEAATLRDLQRHENTAEKQRLALALEKLGYRLQHVAPHLFISRGRFGVGVRTDADGSVVWRPSQPLLLENADADVALRALGSMRRDALANVAYALWDVTLLETDGKFTLKLDARESDGFQAYVRTRYAPPSGLSEEAWQRRVEEFRPVAAVTAAKVLRIPFENALK